jgi:GTP-binding protein
VALRVEEQDDDTFNVSGRGVLHLSILIENMRREGFELTVAQPRVIYKEIDGVKCEPFELLTVDVSDDRAGKVIALVGSRRGDLIRVEQHGVRKIQEFHIPTRGTIGLRSKLLTVTAGEAVVHHCFSVDVGIEYIAADELVEVTPKNIRLRKRIIKEYDRKQLRRQANA